MRNPFWERTAPSVILLFLAIMPAYAQQTEPTQQNDASTSSPPPAQEGDGRRRCPAEKACSPQKPYIILEKGTTLKP